MRRLRLRSDSEIDEGSPDALVEVRQLEKKFPLPERSKFVQACNDVSFSIARGETLGLVGESGSGKTTVGRCILRLIEPTSGHIYLSGRRIDMLNMRQLLPYRAKLQIVFQEPFESLNPRMSVRATLEEPLGLHTELDRKGRRSRTRELLEQVGLEGKVLRARPRDLSSGDQQRVAIARALAPAPDFVVLDEPTSSLPPDAQQEVLSLLRSLQDSLNLSYLFVSHDLSLVRYFCNRVAVMYLSQIVEIGSLEQVFGQPRHPYSRALLAAVLEPDPKARRSERQNIYRLEGEIPSPVDLPAGCYLASRCPLVKERCRVEPQILREIEPNHFVRCWRIAEGDVAQEAFDAADRPPTA